MTVDLQRAASFMATHARILDRRRFELLTTEGDHTSASTALLAALGAYRNPDGGYGRGLEPDLRSSESQPAAAMHAFEAMADAAPATIPETSTLCDWLLSITRPDGGLPFALPVTDPAGCAPFWVGADPRASSLQITAAVATQAYRVARFDESVRKHSWLATVTHYCLDAIREIHGAPPAYVLSFALRFLDNAADDVPEALVLIEHLVSFLPADGVVPVEGGSPGESLHLLDFAPSPNRPLRTSLSEDAVTADLDRLASRQQGDGGWSVDFQSYSPAATLEWRGYMTVAAVSTLHEPLTPTHRGFDETGGGVRRAT